MKYMVNMNLCFPISKKNIVYVVFYVMFGGFICFWVFHFWNNSVSFSSIHKFWMSPWYFLLPPPFFFSLDSLMNYVGFRILMFITTIQVSVTEVIPYEGFKVNSLCFVCTCSLTVSFGIWKKHLINITVTIYSFSFFYERFCNVYQKYSPLVLDSSYIGRFKFKKRYGSFIDYKARKVVDGFHFQVKAILSSKIKRSINVWQIQNIMMGRTVYKSAT